MLLHAALEIESDAFWTSITSTGFKMMILRHTKVAKALTTSHSWLEKFPNAENANSVETFQAILRAVKWGRVHAKQQNKYSSDDSSEE